MSNEHYCYHGDRISWADLCRSVYSIGFRADVQKHAGISWSVQSKLYVHSRQQVEDRPSITNKDNLLLWRLFSTWADPPFEQRRDQAEQHKPPTCWEMKAELPSLPSRKHLHLVGSCAETKLKTEHILRAPGCFLLRHPHCFSCWFSGFFNLIYF